MSDEEIAALRAAIADPEGPPIYWCPYGDVEEAKRVCGSMGPGYQHPIDETPEPGPVVFLRNGGYVALFGCEAADWYVAKPFFNLSKLERSDR